MGIKIKQYNKAVNELIEKRYLVQSAEGGNHYDFYEVAKAVIPSQDNAVITKEDKALYPCGTRNIIDTTTDNTDIENTNFYF